MAVPIKILGFGGSFRKGSYSKAILNAAKELAPKDSVIEIFDIKDIPLFNQDHEATPPESVSMFKKKIKDADAILISTPEYNYSIPGYLKNAIDWVSRPYGDNSFEGKPVALMSSSGGMLGGSRAQYHLRQAFVFLNIHPINRPEVIIPSVHEKLDANGKLIDPMTKEKITELITALSEWSRQLKK
ncbi:MAG: NAD(P)H-dependent oxidoreductase [Candidatus Marsarchaeota archaeon]|nr:NAD(P)H-dependent oxidoreductase [Candidatus Marsarchaeota archaeon]MCL5413031.1 NAD(P)H-dependent oxidoreductase [Candidatus Marsarchaeota archaeon]